MVDILYQKYLNLQKFIVKYRNYEAIGGFLDNKSFNKQMLTDHYIKCECINHRSRDEDKKIYIYLLKTDCKHLKTTSAFKKLILSLGKNPVNVIIISKDLLNIYIKKQIAKLPNLNIQNYLHKHFVNEIPKGPHCSAHRILTPDEAKNICNKHLLANQLSLPSIIVTHPQCIWIGAEIDDIIEINSISELSGKSIRYRIVKPDDELNVIPESEEPEQI